jgi:GNAT superfamily N-acetyltransferase
LKYEKISLICDEKFHFYFIKKGFSVNPRVELELSKGHQQSPIVIPIGYKVLAIDNLDLFKQCVWFDFISSFYCGPERFLKQGLGFALVNEAGKSVAESYAVVGAGLGEIGVATRAEFQGKGFATFISNHMIHECQKRGLKPIWSCDVDNSASLKVAIKLGFEIKRYYLFLKKG